jgi:hypothetical protein
MKIFLVFLAIVILVLLNACTENNTMHEQPLFAEAIDVESNLGGSDNYYSYHDYAIGGTSGGIFSDASQLSIPLNFEYSGLGAFGQSAGGGGTSGSTGQLNGYSTLGLSSGLALASSQLRSGSYGDSYVLGNNAFGSGSGEGNGFNVQSQEFGTVLYSPLGSGWLILVAAGAGYALVKRRKKD